RTPPRGDTHLHAESGKRLRCPDLAAPEDHEDQDRPCRPADHAHLAAPADHAHPEAPADPADQSRPARPCRPARHPRRPRHLHRSHPSGRAHPEGRARRAHPEALADLAPPADLAGECAACRPSPAPGAQVPPPPCNSGRPARAARRAQSRHATHTTPYPARSAGAPPRPDDARPGQSPFRRPALQFPASSLSSASRRSNSSSDTLGSTLAIFNTSSTVLCAESPRSRRDSLLTAMMSSTRPVVADTRPANLSTSSATSLITVPFRSDGVRHRETQNASIRQ